MSIHKFFYTVKPAIPRRLQIILRRWLVRRQRSQHIKVWPIDRQAAPAADHSSCRWQDEKPFALVLTHDVDTLKGVQNCEALAEIEKDLGFRSSFNFVPERYPIPWELIEKLRCDGFEIGVHGLKHDGMLYQSREIFMQRAEKINRYIKSWRAAGFRSPAMHHNLEWLHKLEILYDASTFDTDPFEPQSDGVQSILPFIVSDRAQNRSYVELPYTLAQDFTLFVLLQEKDISIWKQKLDWIVQHRGMALLNTHPDYMEFNGKKCGLETYPVQRYIDFLNYLKLFYGGKYWLALPRDIALFWQSRIMLQRIQRSGDCRTRRVGADGKILKPHTIDTY